MYIPHYYPNSLHTTKSSHMYTATHIHTLIHIFLPIRGQKSLCSINSSAFFLGAWDLKKWLDSQVN